VSEQWGAGQIDQPAAPKKHGARNWALGIGGGLVAITVLGAILGPSEDDAGKTATVAEATTSPTEAQMPETTAAPKPTPAAKPKPKPTKKAGPGIGSKVRDGKFQFTVTKVRKGVKQIGSNDFGAKAQGQFVIVTVKVENIGDKSQALSASAQTLYDSKGRKFDADDGAAIYLPDSNSLYEPINPGNTLKSMIVFDVPKGAKLVKLELHDSVFSGGVDVAL
jgi:Domain of unknown function (DUF4352)